jgi:hypothetical protein
MPFDDRRCVIGIKAATDAVAVLKAMLSPTNVLDSGCRVRKHPDACALCVANNDCSRLPVHVNCRCQPEPYLYALED